MGIFLLDDLKVYYKLDEAGISDTRVDESPNGLDMTGTVNVQAGLLNNAIRGTQNPVNFLTAPHDVLWRAAGDLTVSAWARVPTGTLTINHPLISHWSTPGNQKGWLLYGRNSTDRWAFECSADGSAATRVEWSASYAVETWYHILAEYDDTLNQLTISIDRGTPVTQAFVGPIFAATSAAYIAAFNVSSFLSGGAVQDETGVWDRLLNTDEKDTLYGAGTPPSFDTFVSSAVVGPTAPVCREPIQIIELDSDQCRLLYAKSPCGAVLGTTGVRKCYNTRETCQDPENYDSAPMVVDQATVAKDISSAGAVESMHDVSADETTPTGVEISRDGTKLYIVGQDNDNVRQYPLSIPFDIDSAGALEASFAISASHEQVPKSVRFSSDGLRLHIVGIQQDNVRQYNLTTAWDISTASALTASFDVSSEDGRPQGIYLSPDNSMLYMVGTDSQSVHEYVVGTPGDISTAGTVTASFDVSGEETFPEGVFFNSQGTKMYVIGFNSDKVHQYPLTIAWDLSTAGSVEASFDVSGEESVPRDLAISVDGTKLYIVGGTQEVHQYPITGALAGLARDAAGTVDIDDTGAVEVTEDVSSEDNQIRGLHFKPDGLKVFTCGAQNEKVYQYGLTTAWDLSTITAVEDDFTDGSSTNPGQLFWKPDGTRLFIVQVSFGGTEQVRQYDATIPWDLSSLGASVTGVLDVSGEETNPGGLFFKSDGTKVYVTGLTSNIIHQYPLGTAWDVQTAGAVEASFDFVGEDTNPTGIFFREDGAKLYMCGTVSDRVHQYPVGTPWDVSTVGAVEASFDVSGEDLLPRDIFFKDDGTKLYMCGETNNSIYQYPVDLLEGTVDGATYVRSCPTGFSQALSFDGVDDSVEVRDDNDRYGFVGTAAFTVEFLIEPVSVTPGGILVSKIYTDVSGTQGWRIRLRQSDTTLVFERFLDSAADEASATVTLNKPCLWSCVYDGTDLILYEQGREVARVASAKIITVNGAALRVGNSAYGATTSPYNGLFDELRIWDDARTETEIRERMILPISGREAGVVSYFPFDTVPLGVATRTLRFVKPQITAPKDEYLIPILTNVSNAPTRLNPGGGSRDRGVLGDRAVVDIDFKDAPGSDRVVDKYRTERIDGTAQTDEVGYQPLDRGTFWSKWRARSQYFQNRRLRVLEGYIAEALRNMQTREYFIDEFHGPNNDSQVSFRAKDVLKFADDRRAQAPEATPGELSASLTDSETTSFQATGAVIADYPDEPGLVRIGDEVIEYTTRTQATSDNVQFNTLTRGARGSTAASHDAEDRVQRCLEFVSVLPWKLVEDLLVNFGNVPQEFIPIDDWDAEGEVWLTQFTLSAVITEPTSVSELLGEITQQAQFFIWWDEYTQTVKMKALRPPTEDPVALNDTNHLMQNTTAMREHPKQRLSQVWVFFNQKDPTKAVDEESNYARVRIRADLEAESGTQYGEARITKVFSRWLETEGQVVQVTKRTLDRYRNNPRTMSIRIDAKDRNTVRVGEVVDITTRTIVDERGLEATTRWQVISTQESPPGEAVTVELQEFEFTGRFAFYMVDTAPDFTAASDLEKKFGAFYAEDDGQMPDGSEGYQLQ